MVALTCGNNEMYKLYSNSEFRHGPEFLPTTQYRQIKIPTTHIRISRHLFVFDYCLK